MLLVDHSIISSLVNQPLTMMNGQPIPPTTMVPALLQDLPEPFQQQLVERVANLAETFGPWQRSACVETIQALGTGGCSHDGGKDAAQRQGTSFCPMNDLIY